MEHWKQELQQQLQQLKAQRDQVQLQMHLAKADARDQWYKLEKRYEQLRSKSKQALQEANASGSEVIDDLKLTGEDIKAAYQRIKDKLH